MKYDAIKEAKIIANNVGKLDRPTIDYLAAKLEIAFTEGEMNQMRKSMDTKGGGNE